MYVIKLLFCVSLITQTLKVFMVLRKQLINQEITNISQTCDSNTKKQYY